MKIYNTMSKKKEDFVPLEEGKVKMYVCGLRYIILSISECPSDDRF